jgi:hypothetical protein
MAVALAALDAVVRTQGPDGERAIPLAELHRLPLARLAAVKLPADRCEGDEQGRCGSAVSGVPHWVYLSLRTPVTDV